MPYEGTLLQHGEPERREIPDPVRREQGDCGIEVAAIGSLKRSRRTASSRSGVVGSWVIVPRSIARSGLGCSRPASPFLWIEKPRGVVEVWALGEDRFGITAPGHEQIVTGFEEAEQTADAVAEGLG
jgi:hypothetical protein